MKPDIVTLFPAPASVVLAIATSICLPEPSGSALVRIVCGAPGTNAGREAPRIQGQDSCPAHYHIGHIENYGQQLHLPCGAGWVVATHVGARRDMDINS